MKQTNNAIKFLMAQYRAIFKNANLKMFLAAATAAAAMAAGQAQAATDAWKNLSGTEVYSGGSAEVVYQDADAENLKNKNGFTLEVQSGTVKFQGQDNAASEFTVSGAGKTGSITQTGGEIIIGVDQKANATLTIDSFTTKSGKLAIGSANSSGAAASVLNAKTITIGDANVEGEGPAVNVGAKGQLGGDQTTSISINAGTLTFSDDISAKASTSVSVAGGSVVVDPSKTATLTTPSLSVTGGKVSVGEGSSLKIDHSDANSLSFAAGTIENKGTIDLGKSGTTLSVAASDFSATGGLFASETAKVTAVGAVAGKKYDITLTGEGSVDLGLILTDTGDKNDKHIDLASGEVSLSVEKAKTNFSGSKIATLTSGSFAELEAGKDGALAIDKTAVTISKKLTVPSATEGEYGTLAIDNGGSLTLDGTGVVNAKSITLGGTAKGSLSVQSGDWEVQSLIISSGSGSVAKGSTLTVTGDLTTKGENDKLSILGTLDASAAGKTTFASSGAELDGGMLILDKDDVFKVSGDTVALLDGTGDTSKMTEDGISGNATSVLQINNVGELTVKQVTDLKSKFGKFQGFLQFGGENNIATESGLKKWNDISGGAGINGIYNDVTLNEDTVNAQAAVGNIKLATDSKTEFVVNNTAVFLNNANANDTAGKFVMNSSGDTAGLQLSGTSASVVLLSTGEIGSISVDAASANSGSISVGHATGTGTVTVKGGVGTASAAIKEVSVLDGSSLTISGEAADGLYANQLKIETGATLDATGHDMVLGSGSVASTLNGKLNAKTLTLSGASVAHNIAGGADITVDTLKATADTVTINVGADDVPNGTASVFANKLELTGATLNIDPNYGQHYASTMALNLTGASGDTLDGLVNVGKNSVFAVGFEKAADVDAALGDLIANGSFNDPTPPADTPATVADPAAPAATPLATNALVLNKKINLGTAGGIHVGTNPVSAAAKKDLVVDADGAVVITDAVYSIDPTTGKKTGDAITLDSTGKATIAAGSSLYLVGSFNGADDNLSVVAGGNGTVKDQLANMKVYVGSDLLDAKINQDGTFDISLTTDKARLATAFTDSATPVRDLLLDVLDGHKIPFSTQAGYKFLDSVAKNTGKLGAAADAAAHAATYAGAQQAAVASVTTMAEAVGSRIGGLGVEATAIQATGSQANGGVWLTPMYKTVDADGFGAQGATYGADVDLAGVAFGTDTVNGNMRFGAVFNIGSGDADGKGNGNGLKDEFDYYGFGMYSVMGFGNFALVGDASLNVISHDVEGLGLKGEADTTAVTMGVTGQYTISNPMVDVTPHLGARFIRLDTDSYDLTSADGVVANTDFEVQNVFSVPLGVTLSKAFEMGGWALAPSADLSITFNTGDTDVESSTYFTGARAVNLTTEVLDEVTYGVALGLGAQYGAFGTAINVNYTGSENTDAFGVNAQARYMF